MCASTHRPSGDEYHLIWSSASGDVTFGTLRGIRGLQWPGHSLIWCARHPTMPHVAISVHTNNSGHVLFCQEICFFRLFLVSGRMNCDVDACFRFGRTKSILWLQSLVFSFIQCVFITHPVLVSYSPSSRCLSNDTRGKFRTIYCSNECMDTMLWDSSI